MEVLEMQVINVMNWCYFLSGVAAKQDPGWCRLIAGARWLDSPGGHHTAGAGPNWIGKISIQSAAGRPLFFSISFTMPPLLSTPSTSLFVTPIYKKKKKKWNGNISKFWWNSLQVFTDLPKCPRAFPILKPSFEFKSTEFAGRLGDLTFNQHQSCWVFNNHPLRRGNKLNLDVLLRFLAEFQWPRILHFQFQPSYLYGLESDKTDCNINLPLKRIYYYHYHFFKFQHAFSDLIMAAESAAPTAASYETTSTFIGDYTAECSQDTQSKHGTVTWLKKRLVYPRPAYFQPVWIGPVTAIGRRHLTRVSNCQFDGALCHFGERPFKRNKRAGSAAKIKRKRKKKKKSRQLEACGAWHMVSLAEISAIPIDINRFEPLGLVSVNEP